MRRRKISQFIRFNGKNAWAIIKIQITSLNKMEKARKNKKKNIWMNGKEWEKSKRKERKKNLQISIVNNSNEWIQILEREATNLIGKIFYDNKSREREQNTTTLSQQPAAIHDLIPNFFLSCCCCCCRCSFSSSSPSNKMFRWICVWIFSVEYPHYLLAKMSF